MSFLEKHEYTEKRNGICYKRYDISLLIEDPDAKTETDGPVNETLLNAIDQLFQEINEDGDLELSEQEEDLLEHIKYHISGYVRHCMLNYDPQLVAC
jgi:hypothetical protein